MSQCIVVIAPYSCAEDNNCLLTCGELFQSLYLFELFLKRTGARLKGGGRAAGVGARWGWRQGGQVGRRQGAHADQAGARL